ncbi:hypothetical protein MNEG_15763 [Monoraphidium neglectum]|uniref:Uncharacterized protein n=1 Tax=Monoraphidium neglectum TaxID=145388 RepID=A0A0D2MA13_9CHLO|nr:hypothetical protein MNEG_15763 [Monoraphidium neglectum]KIY92200.1 hypothetical protein MNEG_15763 [Monoraphidium neglectum]|eukprot:XP_013891220.1 hypothetical protein MNEG_15763 [Monoraphidium neglectum]
MPPDDGPDADADDRAPPQRPAPRDPDDDGAAEAASEAEAKTAAARALLEGGILEEIVSLHARLFAALGQQQQQQQQQQQEQGGEAAGRRTFELCYALGAQLAAAQEGRLPAAVDAAARGGHLMRLSQERAALASGAAASSAAAVALAAAAAAAAAGEGAGRGKGMDADDMDAASAEAAGASIDLQQPFIEETALMQAPVAAVAARCASLLAEWPEHPLLCVLAGICERLMALPLAAPLKTALTGLELLLARAQVWEETAAKRVSLKAELSAVAAVATRWRRLELASWRGLLVRAAARHAAGARRSWFHLYALLTGRPEAPAAAPRDGDDDAATAAAAAAAAAAEAGGDGDADAAYRRAASLIEAFVQTSTVGEFGARLDLLRSFAAQMATAAASSDGTHPGAEGGAGAPAAGPAALAAALSNTVAYYGQYAPAVEAALSAGLAPLAKELRDFVALAKWEDRGYYSMKNSTEKAQRQLHRLARRAEQFFGGRGSV